MADERERRRDCRRVSAYLAGLLRWYVPFNRLLGGGGGCFISDAILNAETASFHGGVTLASFVVLTGLDCVARWRKRAISPPSNIRQQLRQVALALCSFLFSPGLILPKSLTKIRYSHISLCLFYSSLTKFMLLVVLAIWGPQVKRYTPHPAYVYKVPFENHFWHVLDDDVFDRTWLVRNLLGGVSAGFGLRGASSRPWPWGKKRF